jgi:hypothetical protein
MPDFVIPDLPEGIITKLQARAKATGLTPEEEAKMILAVGAQLPIPPYWVGWKGPTIPHTELKEAMPGDSLAAEWNTYLREVARLLAEGQEGRCALIKGETILGIYETYDVARCEGVKRFGRESFMVRPILANEPLLRLRGYNLSCSPRGPLSRQVV